MRIVGIKIPLNLFSMFWGISCENYLLKEKMWFNNKIYEPQPDALSKLPENQESHYLTGIVTGDERDTLLMRIICHCKDKYIFGDWASQMINSYWYFLQIWAYFFIKSGIQAQASLWVVLPSWVSELCVSGKGSQIQKSSPGLQPPVSPNCLIVPVSVNRKGSVLTDNPYLGWWMAVPEVYSSSG